MNIIEAKQILESRKEHLDQEIKAKQTIIAAEQEKIRLKEIGERNLRRQEADKLATLMPNKFSTAYTKCHKCKKEVILDNSAGIKTANGALYRVIQCEKCESYNIDHISLMGAANMDKLLGYIIKMN